MRPNFPVQALAALKVHRPQRDGLEWFWECADSANDIGRGQNLRAAPSGIPGQVGAPTEYAGQRSGAPPFQIEYVRLKIFKFALIIFCMKDIAGTGLPATPPNRRLE